MSGRYNMSKDRLAQIDCRMEGVCKFHIEGNCNNVSPAISLNKHSGYVCWSLDYREGYLKSLSEKQEFVFVPDDSGLIAVVDISGDKNYINVNSVGAIIGAADLRGNPCSIIAINGERIWMKETPDELNKLISKHKKQ